MFPILVRGTSCLTPPHFSYDYIIKTDDFKCEFDHFLNTTGHRELIVSGTDTHSDTYYIHTHYIHTFTCITYIHTLLNYIPYTARAEHSISIL